MFLFILVEDLTPSAEHFCTHFGLYDHRDFPIKRSKPNIIKAAFHQGKSNVDIIHASTRYLSGM